MRLLKWDDINKHSFQQQYLDQQLTNYPISVLRTFEKIFEGFNSEVEAHQCKKCGQLFIIGKERTSELVSDEHGGLLCKTCTGQEDANEEKIKKSKEFVFITENIRRWEKSGKKPLLFDELKQNLTEYLRFETIPEMYYEYRMLSKRIESAEPLGDELDIKFKKILDDIFELAKKTNGDEFAKFVFGINHAEEKEIQETINMLQASAVRGELEYWLPKITTHTTWILSIKSKKELDRLRLKMTLLIYGQLMEFGFIYDTLYNISKIAKGKKCLDIPFPNDKNGSPLFPNDKILLIEQENNDLANIVRHYYVPQLRNAIAHAKYAIDSKFVYKTDSKWKMSIAGVDRKVIDARKTFSYLLNKLADEQASIYKEMI